MSKASELKEQAKLLGSVIEKSLPRGVGFCLMLFNFANEGDAGFMSFVSTGDRDCMPTLLREFAANLERESDQALS